MQKHQLENEKRLQQEQLAKEKESQDLLNKLNQRQKEQIIKQRFNKWKRDFYNIYMIPVVEKFMQVYGASIVIDIDSQAFRSVIFDSRINITERVISKMNTSYYNVEELLDNITLQ